MIISFAVAVNTLQLLEVSFEAIESANSLDMAFSALYMLVFLPIKDFWVVVCLIFVVMTVWIGGEKNN